MSGTYDTNYVGYETKKFQNQSMSIEEVEMVIDDLLSFTDKETETVEEMDLIRKYIFLYMEKKMNRTVLTMDESRMLDRWRNNVAQW